MKKILLVIVSLSFIFTACKEEEEIINDNYTPIVKSDSSYNVLKDEDVIYANGLSHDESSTIPFSLPLKLDIYNQKIVLKIDPSLCGFMEVDLLEE